MAKVSDIPDFGACCAHPVLWRDQAVLSAGLALSRP